MEQSRQDLRLGHVWSLGEQQCKGGKSFAGGNRVGISSGLLYIWANFIISIMLMLCTSCARVASRYLLCVAIMSM